MNEYKYGMRHRPFSIGCQPKGTLRVEETEKPYYDIIVYDRELTKEELDRYELEQI